MLQEFDDDEHQRMRLISLPGSHSQKLSMQCLTKSRRVFSPAFSEKALRDQEPIMNRYFDLLIQRLRENGGEVLDINKWYSLLAFDIIGDLTFGESFDCLKNSTFHVKVPALFRTSDLTLS
jgi:hypothetical protein